MASGDDPALDRVLPVLEGFTRLVLRVGEFGTGIRMKLVANHAVAVHNAAAAETLAYADALGLDRDAAYNLLSSGAGQSRMSDLRMPLMMSGAYTPASATLRMFEKDLDLIETDLAKRGRDAPLLHRPGGFIPGRCPICPKITTPPQYSKSFKDGEGQGRNGAFAPCS